MTLAVALMTLLVVTAPSAEDVAAERRRHQRQCESGSGQDCTRLGWDLLNGEAPPLGRALAAFRRGCDLGDGWGCLEAGRTLAQRGDCDPAEVLKLHRQGCEYKNVEACRAIVDDIAGAASKHRFASTADARSALSQLESLCSAGTGRACDALGDFAASGVAGVGAADIAEARRLAERACSLGWKLSCHKAEQLRAEPPSAESAMSAIRERVVRSLLLTRYVKQDPPAEPRPLCVAFGSERDLEGVDPPASFQERFADAPPVRPASWCREHEEGNVVVIGPVSHGSGPPYTDARVWRVLYAWDGTVSPVSIALAWKDGAWALGDYGSRESLELATNGDDHAEDRKRILALVSSFIDAWNRGEPLLDAGSASPPSYGAQHAAAVVDLGRREHTQLEASPRAVDFDLPGWKPTYARVKLRLRGTFVHRPGEVWPLQRWKQAGALSPMELALRRTGGWWRAGRWAIDLESWLTQTPWYVMRVLR